MILFILDCINNKLQLSVIIYMYLHYYNINSNHHFKWHVVVLYDIMKVRWCIVNTDQHIHTNCIYVSVATGL